MEKDELTELQVTLALLENEIHGLFADLRKLIAEWRKAAASADGPRQRLGDNVKDGQYAAMLRQQGLCADALEKLL